MKYQIIVRGRNCARYLGKAINSLLIQTIDNWKALIILDPSEDETWKVAHQYTQQEPEKVSAFMNVNPMGVAYNIYYGVYYSLPLDDEDVIGFVDGDDTIAPNALEVIDDEYKKGCLLTYGSFKNKTTSKRNGMCRSYPKGVNVRKHPYLAAHFRTMKYKVFKHIPVEYFMHKGKWLEAASDVAMMLPGMEIAGLKNCKFIKKKIYNYRDHYSGTMNRKYQLRCEKKVRRKEPLTQIFQ